MIKCIWQVIKKLIKFNRLIYLKILHFNHCYYLCGHFVFTQREK